jgi:D-threo-aldose 1-dehydrogenase
LTTLPFDALAAPAPTALPSSDIPLAPLGRSGLDLPRLGLGCAPLGELFARVSETESEAVLQAAVDSGIRYFDTAPWYGRGKSEHRVGRFLWDKPRDAVVLSTKVGRVFHRRSDPSRPVADQWLGGLPFEHRWDYGYDGIMRSFEDSLQRLGLDTVDMLVIHDLDEWHHGDRAGVLARLGELERSGWRALEELRASGTVRAVGAGINLDSLTGLFLDRMPLDFFVVALRLTLLEHARFLAEEMPRLAAQGVGVVAAAVYSTGLGATGPAPGARFNYAPADPTILAHAGRIQAVCARHGVPLAAAALQFPLQVPGVASVIPGANDAAQVRALAAGFRQPIPPVLWDELEAENLVSLRR